MAGIATKQFEMFDQLRRDGWHIFDMKEYESKIFDVVDWCRDTLGSMLTVYDADFWNCRWHGAQVEVPNSGYPGNVMVLFAFKDPADYTMLRLKFA
jgi:hypothetical protein